VSVAVAKAQMKKPASAKRIERRFGKYTLIQTNRGKIYWPGENISKGDLLDYYEAIAPFILPHLKNRPLSLKRNPNGINDKGFYHKDAGQDPPPFADVFRVKNETDRKTINYLVCNNIQTLLFVANLASIEMNPWNSTIRKPGHPTWMVIDIDPSDGNTFSQVVDAALATKEVLDRAGVHAYCKTSGASGLHVYVPLKNRYPYEEVKEFARLVASRVQELLPATTTLERTVKKRGDRIYVDFLQNRIGQTLASAYSIRPVKGATASTPLEWKEVKHSLSPSQFTIHNLAARAKRKGDIFLPVLYESINMDKATKILKAG
jgi:bifunctional non-homologous end joining protein LigD